MSLSLTSKSREICDFIPHEMLKLSCIKGYKELLFYSGIIKQQDVV